MKCKNRLVLLFNIFFSLVFLAENLKRQGKPGFILKNGINKALIARIMCEISKWNIVQKKTVFCSLLKRQLKMVFELISSISNEEHIVSWTIEHTFIAVYRKWAFDRAIFFFSLKNIPIFKVFQYNEILYNLTSKPGTVILWKTTATAIRRIEFEYNCFSV